MWGLQSFIGLAQICISPSCAALSNGQRTSGPCSHTETLMLHEEVRVCLDVSAPHHHVPHTLVGSLAPKPWVSHKMWFCLGRSCAECSICSELGRQDRALSTEGQRAFIQGKEGNGSKSGSESSIQECWLDPNQASLVLLANLAFMCGCNGPCVPS